MGLPEKRRIYLFTEIKHLHFKSFSFPKRNNHPLPDEKMPPATHTELYSYLCHPFAPSFPPLPPHLPMSTPLTTPLWSPILFLAMFLQFGSNKIIEPLAIIGIARGKIAFFHFNFFSANS